ncbi:hypothetical protein HOC11_07995, partial [archaeon]|nr:hypothetical protein [archaeon]
MKNKKRIIAISLFIVVWVIIFGLIFFLKFYEKIESPTGNVISSLDIPSCVQDRSCCKDVTGNVNKLCWRNDTTSMSEMNSYDIDYHYEEGNYETMFLHYYGSDWNVGNPTEFSNYKGDGSEFRSYGTLLRGWHINEGIVKDHRWTPYKLMASQDVNGLQNNVYV